MIFCDMDGVIVNFDERYQAAVRSLSMGAGASADVAESD